MNLQVTDPGLMDLVELLRCAVNGTQPDSDRIRKMDVDRVYQTAKRHMLTAAAAMVLEAAGFGDDRSSRAVSKAVRRRAFFDADRKVVLQKLEQAGIWYMPLKGAVIQDLYPQYGMREMADHDILFDADRAEDVKTIMEGLGFTAEKYGTDIHDCYSKKSITSFEMHRMLFRSASEGVLSRYFQDVRSRLIRDEGTQYGYHFTPEDLYLYLTAHEYNHFSRGGTGLRSLLDIYLYLRDRELDWTYIDKELKTIGLTGFERRNRSLAQHLFGDAELSKEDRDMLAYIEDSGTYGTQIHWQEHWLENRVRQHGMGPSGAVRYTLSRIFLPMSKVREAFPIFARYPVLLPLLPFYRLGRGLLVSRGRIREEFRAIRTAGKKE